VIPETRTPRPDYVALALAVLVALAYLAALFHAWARAADPSVPGSGFRVLSNPEPGTRNPEPRSVLPVPGFGFRVPGWWRLVDVAELMVAAGQGVRIEHGGGS
jgi:hypothetical protein